MLHDIDPRRLLRRGDRRDQGSLDRVQRLDLLGVILLIGFVASVCVHYVEGFYLNRKYPHSTPLYGPSDKLNTSVQGLGVHSFSDFWVAWHQTRDAAPYLHPTIPVADNYFPFTHVALWPLAQLSYPIAVTLFLVGFTLCYVAIVWRTIDFVGPLTRVRMVVVLTFMAYPVVFLLDRGNVEGLVFLALWAFVALLVANRPAQAAVALGIGAAFKVAPLALGLIFFKKRQIKEIGIVLVVGVAATLIGFLVVGGNLNDNFDALRTALDEFHQWATGIRGPQHDTSIYGMMAAFEGEWPGLHFLVDIYQPVSYVFFVACVGVVAFRRLALWEQLTLLVAAMTIAPVNAYDYRLIEFMLPLFVLLRDGARGRRETAATVLFGLLLIPKGFPVLYSDVTISVILNPIIVIALAAVAGSGRRRAPAGEPAPEPAPATQRAISA